MGLGADGKGSLYDTVNIISSSNLLGIVSVTFFDDDNIAQLAGIDKYTIPS